MLAAAASGALLAGCSAAPAPPSTASPSAKSAVPAASAVSPGIAVSRVTSRPVTMADAARCPATRPGRFEPPPGVPYDVLFGADNSHGNGQLWVGGLGDNGVIVAGPDFVNRDGSIGMKFGWYRVAPGQLTITGRRLDAPAPPARGSAPSGYGTAGFQASGVTFPTEGCWEITGAVDSATLTFVTFVIKS